MSTPSTRCTSEIGVFLQKLLKLERTGRYERALCEIDEGWADPHFSPDTSGLSEAESADLLLRFAALLGFHGHNLQLAESQVRSKNILTDVHERFLDLGDRDKVWESKNYLALAYWRTGELSEADIWIDTVLSEMPEQLSETRLHAHVIQSLVRLSAGRFLENIAASGELAPLFFSFGNAFLTGSFCTNIGLSFKNAGHSDEALRYLELARDYHEVSDHEIYLGTVENNLAQLYKNVGRFSKAHGAIDGAVRAFRKMRDKTRTGFALDTKASIHLAEGEDAMALDVIDSAIKLLRKSENAAYLTETLSTKFKIQLNLGDIAGAISTLKRAVETARVRMGESFAESIFETFRTAANARADRMRATTQPTPALMDSGQLKLVLPESLSQFEDYSGIWINNDHLQSVGLRKGSLAVVVDAEIVRGDLAALVVKETNAVSCGFYDEDFGIVCLEGVGTEPRLFDSGDIRMLGKIVGVCSGGTDENGKMSVQPLTPR